MNFISIFALPRKASAAGVLLVSAVLIMKGAMAAGPANIPRPFVAAPALNVFAAMQMQRHQSRTQLYREALEELRKNPQAADVPECTADGASTGVLCLARAKAAPPVAEPEKTGKPSIVRRRFAVLFGNNGYKDPIPRLDTPVADVEKIANILKNRYGYETRVLKNVGKAEIIKALNAVAAEAAPEDSVLLFYAGHGYLMDETNMGYWIPVDASVETAAGWISNTDISKLLSAISAHQLILISDSCFSGSLTKEQKVAGGVSEPGNVLKKRSVLAFSSGGEEPVSDAGKEGHSIFAWSLINTLQSTKGIAPGYEIYRVVHGQVTKNYFQEPQYGAVVSAGHAPGGEYIFDAGNR